MHLRMHKSIKNNLSRILSAALSLFFVCATAGCGSIADGAGGSIDYIGYAEMRPTNGEAHHNGVFHQNMIIFGFWFDKDAAQNISGGGGGYRSTRQTIAPLDCHMVFIIENSTQARNSIELVQALIDANEGRADICIAEH